MNLKRTGRQSINRLFEIRNRFDRESSREQLQLLMSLDEVEARSCVELERLHTALCFIRAFPDTIAHHRHAHDQLCSFEQRLGKLPLAMRPKATKTLG